MSADLELSALRKHAKRCDGNISLSPTNAKRLVEHIDALEAKIARAARIERSLAGRTDWNAPTDS